MDISNTIKEKYRLKKVLKISVLSLFLFLVCILIYEYVRTKPYDIHFSNISSSSVTVSWNTKYPTAASVIPIKGNSVLPLRLFCFGKDKYYDTRDVRLAELYAAVNAGIYREGLELNIDDFQTEVKVKDKGKYYTHHVVIKNLDPETEYSFIVGDEFVFSKGNDIDKDSIVKTLPVPDAVISPLPAYGSIRDAKNVAETPIDELAVVTDGIVYFNYLDEFSNERSTVYSSSLNEQGNWYIDISNAVRDNGEPFLEYFEGIPTNILIELILDLGPLGKWKRIELYNEFSPFPTVVINDPMSTGGDNFGITRLESSNTELVKGISAADECRFADWCGPCYASTLYDSCDCPQSVLESRGCDGEDNTQTVQEVANDINKNVCGSDVAVGNYVMIRSGVCGQCMSGGYYKTDGVDISNCETVIVDPGGPEEEGGQGMSPPPQTFYRIQNGFCVKTTSDFCLPNNCFESEETCNKVRVKQIENNSTSCYRVSDGCKEAVVTSADTCNNTNGLYDSMGECLRISPNCDDGWSTNNCLDFVIRGETECLKKISSGHYCFKINWINKTPVPQIVTPVEKLEESRINEICSSEFCGCPEGSLGSESAEWFVTQGQYCREVNFCTVDRIGKVCMRNGTTCVISKDNIPVCEGPAPQGSNFNNNPQPRISLLKNALPLTYAQEETPSTTQYLIDSQTGLFVNLPIGVYIVEYQGEKYSLFVDTEGESVQSLLYIDKNDNSTFDEEVDINLSENPSTINLVQVEGYFSYDLKQGFNFVSFPFLVNTTEDSPTAASLLKDLNETYGNQIYSISKYDGVWKMVGQNVEIYDSNDFQLLPGQGYVIKAKGDISITLTGQPVQYETTTDSAPITLFPGWNLIGMYGSNTKQYTAKSLLKDINTFESIDFTADNVSKWDSDVQRYDGLQVINDSGMELEYGFDFPINMLNSYFVRVQTGSGNWQPQLAQ